MTLVVVEAKVIGVEAIYNTFGYAFHSVMVDKLTDKLPDGFTPLLFQSSRKREQREPDHD